MTPAFPGYYYTLFQILNTIPARPGLFTSLVIFPTPLASQLDQFWSPGYMYTFLRARDTPRTRPVVVALQTKDQIDAI